MTFNFGTPKTASGFTLPSSTASTAAPAPTAAPKFQFGSGAGDAKTLPQNKPAFGLFSTPTTAAPTSSAQPASGFTFQNFGGPSQAAPFQFSTPAATVASSLFGPGSAVTITPVVPTTQSTANLPQFNFASSLTPTTATAAPITIGGTAAPSPLQIGSSIAAPITGQIAAAAPITGQISVGGQISSGAQISVGGQIPAGIQTAASSTPNLPSSSTLTFNFAPPTSTPSTSISSPASSNAPTLTFNLGAIPKSVAATTSSLVTSSAPGGVSLGVVSTSATTTTATTLPSLPYESAVPSGPLTYTQLEDLINKWTIDLEEQGKIFSNQAKQLNAWDRLLITNGDKILNLNLGIERVKQEQQQLDQELDFVLAQQKELEDLIAPLEKELELMPVADVDRNNIYQMAENMDSQLKQMTEDLKEVIEQINEQNRANKMSNPITQIGKILNAHMNSLQWIDRNTTKISTHLDTIIKLHDTNKRNQEIKLQRSFD